MGFDATAEYIGIKNIGDIISTGNYNSLVEMAIDGVNNAKSAATVDTGLLRNSIQWNVEGKKEGGLNDNPGDKAEGSKLPSPGDNSAYIGTNVFYATYIEFGTRKQAPKPYLRPSMLILKGDAPKIVAEKMNEEFKIGPLKAGVERVKF